MRLVADESVDRQIVEALRQEGHEVLYVAELEPGTADDLILSRARSGKALLITADKDFGELVFRQAKLTSGVALLRLAGLSSERKAMLVAASVRGHGAEMTGAFTVISPGGIRIRPGDFFRTRP